MKSQFLSPNMDVSTSPLAALSGQSTQRNSILSSAEFRSLQDEMLEEVENNMAQNVFVDNFGFYISLEEKAAESALLRSPAAVRNQNKWRSTLLPHWRKLTKEQKKQCCRKGIPQAFRKQVWLLLLNINDVSSSAQRSSRKEEEMKRYHAYCDKPFTEEQEKKYGSIIENDLPRTFSTNILFNSELSPAGQEHVRRVLRAYCHHDPAVGYCQGMASLAATLVLIMENDYDAFLCLCAMMENERYNLHDFYRDGFPELNRYLNVLEALLKKTVPKVWKVFEKESVIYSSFATSWMLTLFSHTLNFRLVCRIWDMFFCEGWKPMLRVVLALLKMEQDRLVEAKDYTGVMVVLHHIADGKNPATILQVAMDIKFTTATMEELRSKSSATLPP